MHKRDSGFALLLSLGLVLAAAVTTTSCATEEEGELIKVLAVLPNTGAFETRGERYKGAMQLAVAELKRGLEAEGLAADHILSGQEFRVILVDSGDGKTTAAKDAARENIQAALNEHPDIVAAITATGNAHKLTLPLGLEQGFPVIETASGGKWDEFIDRSKLAEGMSKYSFSARALCLDLAAIAADFIIEKQQTDGWNSVWLARGDKAHDKMHVRVVRQALEAPGSGFTGTIYPQPAAGEREATVVAAEQIEFTTDYGGTGPYSRADYREYVERELTAIYDATGSFPDVVFWHLRGDSFNKGFMEAFRDLRDGFFDESNPNRKMPKLVTCGMARNANLVSNGPGSPNLVDFLADNLWFAMRGPIDSEGTLDRFKADLEAHIGVKSDTWAPAVHDAMMVVGLAVALVNSKDRSAVRAAMESVMTGRRMNSDVENPQAVKIGYRQAAKAFLAIKNGELINYDGPAGPLHIDPVERTIPGRYYVEAITFVAGASTGGYCVEPSPAPHIRPTDPVRTAASGNLCR